jgi:hypothetical protein
MQWFGSGAKIPKYYLISKYFLPERNEKFLKEYIYLFLVIMKTMNSF